MAATCACGVRPAYCVRENGKLLACVICAACNPPWLRRALDLGGDPNAVARSDGCWTTPFHRAASVNEYLCIRMLRAAGGAPRPARGVTPLQEFLRHLLPASDTDYAEEIARELLLAGDDPTFGEAGDRPVDLCLGHEKLADLLAAAARAGTKRAPAGA